MLAQRHVNRNRLSNRKHLPVRGSYGAWAALVQDFCDRARYRYQGGVRFPWTHTATGNTISLCANQPQTIYFLARLTIKSTPFCIGLRLRQTRAATEVSLFILMKSSVFRITGLLKPNSSGKNAILFLTILVVYLGPSNFPFGSSSTFFPIRKVVHLYSIPRLLYHTISTPYRHTTPSRRHLDTSMGRLDRLIKKAPRVLAWAHRSWWFTYKNKCMYGVCVCAILAVRSSYIQTLIVRTVKFKHRGRGLRLRSHKVELSK